MVITTVIVYSLIIGIILLILGAKVQQWYSGDDKPYINLLGKVIEVTGVIIFIPWSITVFMFKLIDRLIYTYIQGDEIYVGKRRR